MSEFYLPKIIFCQALDRPNFPVNSSIIRAEKYMPNVIQVPPAPITERDKQALAASAPKTARSFKSFRIVDEEEEKFRIREPEALTLGWANRGYYSCEFKITDVDRKPPRQVVHISGDPYPGQPKPSCMTPEQITRWNKIIAFLSSNKVYRLTPKVYMAIGSLV